ncbi:MAG: DUF3341 domain-containing protein [Verrucomicrobiota bacterium]
MSKNLDDKPKVEWGVVAEFDDAHSIYHACEQLRKKGFTKWDSFTPFPVHGLEKASGLPRSKVPLFTFLGGSIGFLTGMGIVAYMNWIDYPLIVGGKPYFSPIFPFPIFYELTILLAAFGTLFGMFATNCLPQHHHPLFEHEPFLRASDDAFMVAIERRDPIYDTEKVKKTLADLGAKNISVVEA